MGGDIFNFEVHEPESTGGEFDGLGPAEVVLDALELITGKWESSEDSGGLRSVGGIWS